MATKPQDHKPKKRIANPDKSFEFEHNGDTFTLAAPSQVLTAGFARRTRHMDLANQFFEMVEALADADALSAIDEMQRDEFQQFQRDFYAHAGIELGE